MKQKQEKQSGNEKDEGCVEGRRRSVSQAKVVAGIGQGTPMTSNEEAAPLGAGDFSFLVMPAESYKTLSDIAAAGNMTVAQALSTAINDLRKKTESTTPSPKLLMEQA